MRALVVGVALLCLAAAPARVVHPSDLIGRWRTQAGMILGFHADSTCDQQYYDGDFGPSARWQLHTNGRLEIRPLKGQQKPPPTVMTITGFTGKVLYVRTAEGKLDTWTRIK